MRKSRIYLVTIIIIVLIVASGIYGYKKEERFRSYIKANLTFSDIYEIYLKNTPTISNENYFYGDENASIIFIAYLDFSSESSKMFIDEIFPGLKEEFIDTGKIKFYHKSHISFDDYDKKSESFIYSKSLSCARLIKNNAEFDFYFELFNTSLKELPELVDKYNIPKEEFIECIKNDNLEDIRQDIIDIEKSDILGIKPVFYVGINDPTTRIVGITRYETFKKTIQDFQRQLGD